MEDNQDTIDLARQTRDSVSALSRRMRQERPPHGLGLTSASVLSRLDRVGALSPKELAAHEGVQPQSLTRQLSALEERGLITRRPHDRDGRQVLMEITDAGSRLVAADRQSRDTWLARAIATRLTPVEREVLSAANKLLDLLSET
ncbi:MULTISPECIES: MarR family winged helix-turn-helix transcriptional regulator [Streptomyces]|uniref:MarR family winged helix-turn-helix transcriptional regulator n=1 Tax=Streptomyces TaxID=1883 RepID=UPI000F71FC16|nr:MarR family transcriptional regulator [Streptomyces sp. W1SF4]AZM93644.1 MarR family transcriptional regulator [Streptomyces sp. W1SF4]